MFHSLENDEKCAEVLRSGYGIYSFVCYHCGAMFPSFEQVKPHIESHFAAEPIITYPDHDDNFEEKYELVDVIDIEPYNQINHTDVLPEQEVLDKKYNITDENVPRDSANNDERNISIKTETTQHNQNNHLKRVNTNDKYMCDICKKTFSLKRPLVVHINFHAKPFRCPICNIRFKKVKYLREHGLKCHPNDINEIIQVSSTYAKIDLLERPYKCDVCQLILKEKIQYFNHLSKHADKKQFKCNICGKGFNTNQNRRTHMLLHDSKTLIHKCDQCPRAFRKKSNLVTHLRIHKNDRPYQCKDCDSNFKQPEILKLHIQRVHRKERNAQCPDCGKTFFSKSYLNLHMKDHTDGPFTCGVCNKVFATRTRFQGHKQTHSDQRLYKCDVCDKSFKTSVCLSQHKLIHFDKQFQCRFCDMKFSQNAGKRCHEVNFHRQVKKPYLKKK